MKPLFYILHILLVGFFLNNQAVASCTPEKILRDDVLVVVNDNSLSSPLVGDYYCERRGIDPANVAHVRVPVTNDVSLGQFVSLRDQLIKHMQDNTLPAGATAVTCDTSQGYTRYYCPESVDQLRLNSRIRYLVMTRGLPIRFKFTGSTLDGNPDASVDNYLRFWLTNYFSEDVAFKINNRAIAFGDGRGMRTVDPASDFELIVGRIDGVDTDSAKRLVDRAINAERNGVYGKLYGNKFGGTNVEKSGPEGAFWKRWLPNDSVKVIYPSWHYLHGLFGKLQGIAVPSVRHTTNSECISTGPDGTFPKECVTAVNPGAISDSSAVPDLPPGTPWGRIPSPDNALVHLGFLDTFSSLLKFEHVLNWRDTANCNTLCDQGDAACKAVSTDAYQEIDTRCVRVAEGYMGYTFKSYPVGLMASWPTGWFQTNNNNPEKFDLTGGVPYYFWQPEVRDDNGFDDNFSLWYRDTDNAPSSACYAGTEDYKAPPPGRCIQEKKINFNQIVDIPERAIDLSSPQNITIRFKYRAIGLNKNIAVNARLMVRESAYDDGVLSISSTNQVVYPYITVATLNGPDDPADGTSWADAAVTFTLDPALHKHPQYLYDGLKIRIETFALFEGEIAFDNFTIAEDDIDIPLVNASFKDGHRQLSGGDSAATFLSRLNGTAFWGNITHHENIGHSFESHPYETLIYFMRGLPLGDAVWFAEMHNGGIFYGDPIYSPAAIHLHNLSGADSWAPDDNFNTAIDSPLVLRGDALNGSATNVATIYSIDSCSGFNFFTCDLENSWLPVTGIQNLPGGQRDMTLGNWDISSLSEGKYILRLAVTSTNSTNGLSQTFYDYYPVTLYTPTTPTTDADLDGLTFREEAEAGTDPNNSDTDNDGLPDGWEVSNALDALTNNTNVDSDGDGFTDYVEFLRSSAPSDSLSTPDVATHAVDPVNGSNDGKSPFKTIQAAVNSALAGDTILLSPGYHVENSLLITAPIQIRGSSSNSSISLARDLKSNTIGTVIISDISFYSSDLSINDQVWRFEHNEFNSNVTVGRDSSVDFINNLFINSTQDAINISTASDVLIQNNTITGNAVGVKASSASKVRIINSIISDNIFSDVTGINPEAISYSLIGDASLTGGEGNISDDPMFVNLLNDDYHLQPASPAIDAGDPESDFSKELPSKIGRINMGAFGNTPEAAIAAPPKVHSDENSNSPVGQNTSSGQISSLLLLWFSLYGTWRRRLILSA